MKRQRKILCPECRGEMKISYPESFLFNIARVDCKKCGFTDSDDGYSNGEALKALIERLNNRHKQVL